MKLTALILWTAFLLVLSASALSARWQEKLTLAAPVFVDTGASEFRVSSLYLNRMGHEIRAQVAEVNPGTAVFKTNGRLLTCAYAESAADALLLTLNTMNFSTTSLEKRVMLQCQADGKLGAGSISGQPQ